MADRNQLLNDNEEALRVAFDGRISSLWTAFPAIVTAVDLSTQTISAQPAIQGEVMDENGQVKNVDLPVLIHVPIVFPSAGGFTLTFPIAVGNEVLIIIASRCIDAWWQSGGVQRAMEARMHDLSDGFAIPGPRSIPNAVSAISATGAQLRNDAGTSYIEMSADGKIKIVAPAEIDITAPLVKVTGDLTATGIITGGSLVTAGAISAGSGTIGGVPYGSHRHSGVTTGTGNTGGPI